MEPVRQSLHKEHSVGPIHMPGVGLSLQAQWGLDSSPTKGKSKQVMLPPSIGSPGISICPSAGFFSPCLSWPAIVYILPRDQPNENTKQRCACVLAHLSTPLLNGPNSAPNAAWRNPLTGVF